VWITNSDEDIVVFGFEDCEILGFLFCESDENRIEMCCRSVRETKRVGLILMTPHYI